jgi:hypothetical protein
MIEHDLTVIKFMCSLNRRPTAALARTDASVALRTTSGSAGQRSAGMCVCYPRVVCSAVPIGST